MSSLTEARLLIAQQITDAGVECEPYSPDSVTPPIAFIDTVSIDLSQGSGFSFCEAGLARATVIACAERNDRAGSTKKLEDSMKPVLDAIHQIDGVRVTGVQSGMTSLQGQDLPALIFAVEFGITTS